MDSGLLAQIQKGKALKKAQTNDRSAPTVSAPKSSSGPIGGGMARPPIPGMGAPPPAPPSMSHTTSAPPSAASASVPAGPQLGGLFANGMPTLRKTRGGAVNTGRGASSPSAPPPPPPPTGFAPPPPPGRSPAYNNKPPTVSSHNTLPRNFKAPPPIPGRAPPIPSFNTPAPPPPAPPTSFGAGAPPPPPPPPPPLSSGGYVAPGVSPKTQAALVPPIPGRSRSNSSPQRPVPPPPPKAIPSPPSPPRVVPKFGLPNRPTVAPPAPPLNSGLAVPPALPPGRPRSSSISSQQQEQSPIRPSFNHPSPLGAGAPPPPPPPPPPPINGNASPRVNHHSPVATPPRSPLPPPPPSVTNNRFFSAPGTTTRAVPPPSFNSTSRTSHVPLTEGGGRYTFRPTSDLPPPRQIQSGKKHRVYPSGESKGNSYPLDYSRLR